MIKFLTMVLVAVGLLSGNIFDKPKDESENPTEYVTYKIEKKLLESFSKFETQFNDESGSGEKALQDWLNSGTCEEGLSTFNAVEPPETYDETVLRNCKDGFYVLFAEFMYDVIEAPTTTGDIRCMLDHIVPIVSTLGNVLTNFESETPNIEETYASFKEVYDCHTNMLADTYYTETDEDFLEIYSTEERIENMHKDFKNFLVEKSNSFHTRVDDSTNILHSYDKLMNKVSKFISVHPESVFTDEKENLSEIKTAFKNYIFTKKNITTDMEVLCGMNDETPVWEWTLEENETEIAPIYAKKYDALFHFLGMTSYIFEVNDYSSTFLRNFLTNGMPSLYFICDYIDAISIDQKLDVVSCINSVASNNINLYEMLVDKDNVSVDLWLYALRPLRLTSLLRHILFD